MFFDFLKILGIALGLAWVVLLPLLYVFDQTALVREIVIGCLLPVVCFIPGFYAVAQALHRPFRPFMIAVFGGMLVRLLVIGTAFMLLVKFANVHVASFLFSLVGFYTLCLLVELYFINSRTQHREELQE